ncbi:hypothetical protein I6A84_32305 [Frankia sp. CNm7]|uniref:Alpha/beta hydrolase domain-containing protein n=1 Tax=Frankia nepalensis TaxID=1836974 RepID=A0A937RK73_9ACTN|nr:hypothetical protein [Frankia nepalensis]MBL7511976.1 hypothetical protein [Frankia nepalensis]MBL7522645.1 hypothetical protein [Frankia nepalensis]MBL7631782.1 hypothetical protein [Frankia nepalensis]
MVACSGSGGSGQSSSTAPPSGATTTTLARPDGPAADLSMEIAGGDGAFMGEAEPPDLRRLGYVEHEYLATGTASSYRVAGALTHDGRWTFTPDATAPYRTRIVVRQPAKASAFSGNAVVEWLNVSGGSDADPEWVSLEEEIVRRGDVWVGVSAQLIGVVGGPVRVPTSVGADIAGKGLAAINPARYGALQLEHPGDGFSFDIYTQVARAIRAGAGMDGLRPQRLIAAGESQSAFALVTYYNGVQPLTRQFDGFFVHSRGAVGLPLVEPGKSADIAAALGGTPAIFRTDQDAPVLDAQTESDVTSVLNSYAARQPDTDRFRLWEVAGTAHADAHLVGSAAASFDCGVPVNNGPMHLVAKSALRALTTWITAGKPPVIAPRLTVQPATTPQISRDADGIALGGIRTPLVDVPVAILSGAPGSKPSAICLLVGSTQPLSTTRLAQLYPSPAAYLQRYTAAADKSIKDGYVVREDRPALLAFAEPSRITAG